MTTSPGRPHIPRSNQARACALGPVLRTREATAMSAWHRHASSLDAQQLERSLQGSRDPVRPALSDKQMRISCLKSDHITHSQIFLCTYKNKMTLQEAD